MDRRGFLGGSDIPIILGLKPYGKTRYRLWCEKTGRMENQYPEPQEEPDWIKAGRYLEDGIARWFADETGTALVGGSGGIMVRHPKYPFLRAQIDRMFKIKTSPTSEAGCPLEVKNVTGWKTADWAASVPVFVEAQVEWGAGLLQAPKWGVMGLVGGNTPRWMLGDTRPAIFRAMVEKAVYFWGLIQSDTPPALEPEDNETMRDRFPQSNGHVVNLGAEGEGWDMQRLRSISKIAPLLADRDEAEAHLKEALGDAERGVLPSGAFYSWKTGEDGVRRFRRGGER